jgi:formate hydrogenlyase transcriptional activator
MATVSFPLAGAEGNRGYPQQQYENPQLRFPEICPREKLNEAQSDCQLQYEGRFSRIIGSSPTLEVALSEVERVAPTDSTVLVLGETGTGKELIAQAVHDLSRRKGRPFVKLNCAAIPFDLLESELFGHEKGAFTGALAQKIGRFEMAHNGTLFLDEIGDLPLALQPKFLRVLQEQEFERLGSCRTHRINVRVVAATHRNLTEMVAQKAFRSDLYYRLNVFPIELPPLRARQSDIPSLIFHFVDIFARRMRKTIDHIAPETMATFISYSWPGNVRELQNLVERAVILSTDGVLPNPLPVIEKTLIPTGRLAEPNVTSDSVSESTKSLILRTLQETDWMVGGPAGAAARLGLPRTTLISKMKKLGIYQPRSKNTTTLISEKTEVGPAWQTSAR